MTDSMAVTCKTYNAPDGAEIAYQVAGEGPPIVLANGLGGNFDAWTYIARHWLDQGYRILTWDYRGLYSTPAPSNGRIAVTDQVDDLVGILDAEGIDRAVLFGWSMGCQVLFEFAVRRPDRAVALVPICGGAGRPFDRVLNLKTSRFTMPALFRFMSAAAPLFSKGFKAVSDHDILFKLVGATRLFWRGGEDVVRGFLPQFASMDFHVYGHLMLELGRHDIRAALPLVRCPVLFIAADGDVFTPPDAARETHSLVPDCRLAILEGASHFAPLEQPDRINRLIEVFLRDAVSSPWGHANGAKRASRRLSRKNTPT